MSLEKLHADVERLKKRLNKRSRSQSDKAKEQAAAAKQKYENAVGHLIFIETMANRQELDTAISKLKRQREQILAHLAILDERIEYYVGLHQTYETRLAAAKKSVRLAEEKLPRSKTKATKAATETEELLAFQELLKGVDPKVLELLSKK